MSADKKHVSLAADIARVLGGRHLSANDADGSKLSSRCLLMTGVAMAVMQAQPANAVALGELRVQSGLGQPLVATTTARLGAGETIGSNCVSAPAAKGNGLSSPSGLQVSAQNGATPGSYPVQIRSTQPLYEPMYEIRLQVNCPGSVALTKSYVVMLNLPMAAPVEPVRQQIRNTEQPENRNAAKPAAAANGRLAPSRAGIPAGQRYRVRNGDTLSAIAERIEGRPVGSTWRVAEQLFAANPRAFIRGNRDLIKLGAVLDIPTVAELGGTAAQDSPAPAAPAIAEQPAVTGGELVNVTLGRPEDSVSNSASTEDLLREIREANAAQSAATELETAAAPTDAAEAADFSIAADDSAAVTTSPFADEVVNTVDAAETYVEVDDTASGNADAVATTAAPAVSVADETESSGMNPLVAALAGVFMGILLALVMLGRKILGPFLEGRARRRAALESVPAKTDAPADAPEFAPVRPAYGGGGIDVEVGEKAVDTPKIESLLDGLEEEDEDSTDKTALFAAPLPTPEPESEPQPEPAPTIETEGMADTGTMRNLFEEDTASVTAELPAVDAGEVADIDTADLESLSRQLQDSEDERMSATLTQALGLLEQDYEDELTASQILEKKDIAQAFAEQKAKD